MKARGLPASELLQDAVRAAVRRLELLAEGDKYLAEVKKTRPGLSAKELGDQLVIDIMRYSAHDDCKMLICFVYDPEEQLLNPQSLVADLSRTVEGLVVRVVVTQR